MKSTFTHQHIQYLLRDSWVAVGAASLIAARMWMDSKDINPWPVFFGGAVTFIYYSTLHQSFSSISKKNFIIGQLLLVAISIPAFFEIQFPGISDPGMRLRLVLFIGSVIAAGLYLSPLGVKGMIFALRQVPLLKAPLIAFCWTMLTCFLPVLFGEPAVPGSMIFSRWILILAIAILFDVMDSPEDEKKIITFPTAIGIPRTRLLVIVLFVLSDLVLYHNNILQVPLFITPFALWPALLIKPPVTLWKSIWVDAITVVYFPLVYFCW